MNKNPFAPPVASVADARARSAHIPLSIRALQLGGLVAVFLLVLGIYRLVNVVIAARTDEGALTGILLAITWRLIVVGVATAMIIALQRRARSARVMAHAFVLHLLISIIYTGVTSRMSGMNMWEAALFASVILSVWYASCWSKKAKAFFGEAAPPEQLPVS